MTHYQQSDVFVLPSLDEGLPNVVLEAMACGNAIVATDISGNRELVQDSFNGFLVPPADAGALTRALEALIDDANMRRRMGEVSRHIVESYSWSAVADRYLEFSHRIVEGRGERVKEEALLVRLLALTGSLL